MLAGVAGGTKALVFGIATLTDVHYSTSGEVVLTTLLGGLGTVFGPVMGAVLVTTMENYLAQFGAVGDGDAGRDLRDLRAGVPPRRHRRDRRRAAPGAVTRQPDWPATAMIRGPSQIPRQTRSPPQSSSR